MNGNVCPFNPHCPKDNYINNFILATVLVYIQLPFLFLLKRRKCLATELQKCFRFLSFEAISTKERKFKN